LKRLAPSHQPKGARVPDVAVAPFLLEKIAVLAIFSDIASAPAAKSVVFAA
jgi:hypothetical protein